MRVPEGFRNLVNARMRDEGLSLREVAQKAGLSPSFLSRVMSGERGLPPNEDLLRLARALGVRPPVLLLVQAERIPTRSLGDVTDAEMEQLLQAIQQLVTSHRRGTARKKK
jgi:transcriptional regulator with XRE-family HTH domain